METLLVIITWIWANKFELLGWFVLIRYWNRIYQDLIFTPLAGGNGKVQMDEAAKGVILIVFAASSAVEAFRKTEYHIFSDAYYFALLGTVALIAGIKHGVELLRKDKEDPMKTPPSV